MTAKRLNIDLIEDLFVREELIRLYDENEQLKQKTKELELLNDGLNYALQNIRKIDVEIDVGDYK